MIKETDDQAKDNQDGHIDDQVERHRNSPPFFESLLNLKPSRCEYKHFQMESGSLQKKRQIFNPIWLSSCLTSS